MNNAALIHFVLYLLSFISFSRRHFRQKTLSAYAGAAGSTGGFFGPCFYVNNAALIHFVLYLLSFISFSRMPYRQKTLSACPGAAGSAGGIFGGLLLFSKVLREHYCTNPLCHLSPLFSYSLVGCAVK